MIKTTTVCQHCGTEFYKAPAFHRHAEKRGSSIKFCSRACTDAARSAGTIEAKKRRGQNLTCEVCKTEFYRKQSYVNSGKSRFCSEPCRQQAFKDKLIDKSLPRPGMLRGEEITCMFCATVIYRKKSMLERNIGKTCGASVCVSAYGRLLWGLQPRDPAIAALPRPKRKQRTTNFTAAQRKEWLDSECARCGTTDNLTLDHVTAVCCGGESIKENAQTLCGPCNNWKAKYIDRPKSRLQNQ